MGRTGPVKLAHRSSKQQAGNEVPTTAPCTVLSFMPSLDLGDFSFATVLFAILFGLVGFAAFRYGKKNGEPRQLFLGIALMAYGYFVSNAWLSFPIGAPL